MKTKERRQSEHLRKQGLSLNEIVDQIGVSKSSVSIWVRNIPLTKIQKGKLKGNAFRREIIERRRLTRITNENARRQKIVDAAKLNVQKISERELFLIGIGLYWAEGSKTRRGIVEFSNSDPKLIKVMMSFFKKICLVPSKKFRGHIHLHPHLNAENAEKYWSTISTIPTKQFFKTSQQHNRASKGKKDSLPYGTFSIYVCNTELFLKIKGWMEGLYQSVI